MKLRRSSPPPAVAPDRYDHVLDAVLVPDDPRDAGDELWALLLTRQYDGYAEVAAQLPGVPEAEWQELWNGASGTRLAAQTLAFYRVLKPFLTRDARVLDFGCGWGRITRFLARDVPPDRLFGCDPVQGILDVCRRNGVPATFGLSDPTADRLPFDGHFDLAYAFSVFTHLSESAHERALTALHTGLRPGGTLVVTVRPPGHLGEPAGTPFHYVSHAETPENYNWESEDGVDYGDTVITLDYVREHWAPRFELLDAQPLVGDLAQVALTLRRV